MENSIGKYAVIGRFDADTDDRINRLYGNLKKAGFVLSDYPPHITIAAYENIDLKSVCDWTEEFTLKAYKQTVDLRSISILPPTEAFKDTAVICFSPAYSKKFIEFYYAFHEKHEKFCCGIGEFNSISCDMPIIHSTIGIFDLNELQKAMDIIFQSNIWCHAQIESLEIYSYPIHSIRRYYLS